ncbi:MAG: helix-turn-helix transcriptional regulator [Ktedonobacteraceae bacterium]|nr:helix-turn-helix transcriptional regulator [Ktedonobacteraceae bacterium]
MSEKLPNEKLIAARLKQCWSQRDACNACGVGERSYRRWEAGESDPSLASLRLLMDGFRLSADELGYGYLVRIPEATSSNDQIEEAGLRAQQEIRSLVTQEPSLSLVPGLMGNPEQADSFQSITWISEWVVRILSLVNQWRGQAIFCTELQRVLAVEFRMFDNHHPSSSDTVEATLSRRQALFVIAALPKGLLTTLERSSQKGGLVQEEFLPQCTASITACWYLMQGREFAAVERSLSNYLPLLTSLAQQSSPYQKAAAALASQGHFLMGHLAMHKLQYQERVMHCKQAADYGALAGDRLLQASALATLGDALHQTGQRTAMLHTYQQAAQYVDGVPAVLKSKVLGGLAHAYAQQGNTQEVLRCLDEARVIFSAEPEEVPLFLSMDYGPFQSIQYEGQTFMDLGDASGNPDYYHQAGSAFAQVAHLPSTLVVPERVRIEIVNQQAQAAIKMGDLQQFRTLLVTGAQGAKTLGSEKRRQEVVANWKAARKVWPHEALVMELADLLLE